MADSVNAAADFAVRFAALRVEYARQLEATLDELSRRVTGQGPDTPRELLEQFHAGLHKLAGSGGTFGFPELSRQAGALEVTVKGWLDGADPVPPAAWQAWRDGLLALRQTLIPAAD